MSLPALTIKDCTPDAVIQGFRNQEQVWKTGHWSVVERCREAQKGDQLFSLGQNFEKKGMDRVRLRIPQTTTVPLKTINVMARKRPQVRRFATSPSPRHQLMSDNIETWVNSALTTDVGGRPLLDWNALVGKLFLDGACTVIAAPSLASWERIPDFLDTIDEKKFKRLAPNRKARYSPQTDGSYARVDGDGEPMPKRAYWRDARGRDEHDEFYTENPDQKFKRDDAKTEAAYEEAMNAVLAHRPPFNVRVISSTDSMPVYGPGGRLMGVYVRSRYSRETLIKRNYYWGDDEDALVKRGDEDTYGSGEVTLYEWWGYDADGTPFVAYAVEGVDGEAKDTYFSDPDGADDLKPAVINLAEEHGLTRLPATWVWGLHLETDDYPNKAVPFLAPTLSAMSMVEMFISAKAAHALQHGFTSWAIEPDAEIIKLMPDIMLENNKPRTYEIEPNKMFIGPGKPHALVAPQTSPDVNDLIRTVLGMAGAMTPSEAAFGGPGAASGHDRSLTRDYLDTAMSQVLDGALKAYEFVAELVLEIACAISDQFDVEVPIYAKAQVGQAQLLGKGSSGDKAPRVLELDPDWLGEIYDVQAFYPFDPFENIALINLYSQLYKDGLISWEEWRGILGDEHPEMSRIVQWIDQQIQTPEGKALIASLANDIMGGDLEDEIKKLVEDGLMTPDGQPVDSLVDDGEMKALEYLGNKSKARQLLQGSGPFGPGMPAISPNSVATTAGLMAPPAAPPPGAPGTVPQNMYTPPGQDHAPPPPGMPGQRTNIGTGLPNLANSALGGEVAGASEIASIRRDELNQPHR